MIFLFLSQLCLAPSFCQNSCVIKSISLHFQISHERQESSCFHIKVERSSCSRLTDHFATFFIRLWYSAIFQSVASSSGGLWAVYEVMTFTPKPRSHWPRFYCWRSPNVCIIGGQYVITVTGRPNGGHSFCTILNMIWLKKIIFERTSSTR